MSSTLKFLLLVTLLAGCIEGKPFFDAIYDAINGNGRRSYGYSGYGSSGYGNSGYGHNNNNNGYVYRPREVQSAPRSGKSYKEICRAHYPDSIGFPGAGGVVCPY